MKSILFLLSSFMVITSPYSYEISSCDEVDEFIQKSGDSLSLYFVPVKAIDLLKRIGADYSSLLNLNDAPFGEASIKRLSRDRYRMLYLDYAVSDTFLVKEFSLEEKDDGCFFTSVKLPNFNEVERDFLVTIDFDGLLLNPERGNQTANTPLLVSSN